MASSAVAPFETIIGINGDSSGNDLIRTESSVTFDWVPDPAQQYVDVSTIYGYGPDGSPYRIDTPLSGPSSATGTMTFKGVSSSEPFQALPSALDFEFTDLAPLHPDPQSLVGGFSWDPASNMMLQSGVEEAGPWYHLTAFVSDQAYFDFLQADSEHLRVEYGHWALAPDPQNVEAFGGAGNDTIYGGQGDQLLSGDDGNDTLFAGLGNDTLLGGAGNDVIHGGFGTQILDGGAGNDTIYAGFGNQIIMGGSGRDLILAGTGKQTVLGGAGNDTICGGVGAQLMMGGDGDDTIRAGRGNETLLGGGGHDVFALSDGVQGQIVIGDFAPGQDRIEVARQLNGLVLDTPQDVAKHMSGNAQGDAVLNLGSGATVTFSHVSAQRLETHPQNWFKIV